MDPQTVNLALSTSGVVPVSVSAYNANTLILSCEGDLSGGTFEELTAEIYQNANLGEDPLATVTYVGALGAGPHLLTFTPEQTNLLPSAPSILSRGFYLVVRGTGTGGIKTVFVLGRLTLQANPASDIGAPPPAPSLYASNVFRYVAAAGSTSITASGRDDTLTFSVLGAGTVSLNPTTKTVSVRVYGGAAWQSGVAYALDTVVGNDGNAYLCTAAHTSALATEPGTGASWETVWKLSSAAASGDVTGPASSTDNAIARFNGTTGKVIQNSGASVSDAGAVSTDALVLAQTPTTALSAGVIRYDSGEKVPEVGIETVTLKLGVQQYVRVYNDTALTMTRGQVVYISGAQGNRVAVRLASAASESTSAGTLGLVSQTIAAGAEGFVQVQGPMYNLDTSLLTAGALMFLSSTAGTLTATEPPAPQHGVRVAYVERVHATVGSLFIKVDNGYELGELHNVTDSLSGQVAVLVKNASTNVWESKTAAQTLTLIGAYPSSNPSNFSANSTDAYLLSRTNHTGTQATSTITGLDTALSAKADLVGGKLNTSQLPDLAIQQYLGVAANQAAMILLVGQRGDWCSRTDDGKVYIVTAEPSSSAGNWTSLSYPNAPVLSVAGKTGTVTLAAADISNSTATGQSLMTAADSAAATAVLNTFTTSVKGLAPASGGGTTNFLRADGTWAAPPGGTGTAAGTSAELQFRNASTGAFDAVTNSSVSGGTVTLGGAENYGATPVSLLALRNTTAATNPGVAQVTTGQQSSPAFQLEGQGWDYTGGVAASTPVRVRAYVQPQTPFGLANATNVLFRLESQIGSGAWSRLMEFRQSPAQGFLANIGPTGGITLGGSNGNDGFFTGSVSAGVELLAIVSSLATAGTQRNSAIIRQEGQGWNGTASVPVEFRSYVRPTASSPDPTYDYIVEARHNRGAWTTLLRIQTGQLGNVLTTGSVGVSFGSIYGTVLDVAGQIRAGGTFAGTRIRSGDAYQWASSPTDPNQAADLVVGRRAAANLRLGAADAAAPVAQTLSVQSVVAGTASGTVGANFTIDGSQGTGTGAGGDIIFRVAPALATSGTAQNPHVESLRLRAGRGIAVSNSGFTTPTAQESLGEITVMNGVSVGSGAAVALSETWGVKWVTATAYALGARVYNNQGSYRCISAHTSGGTTEPGVGGSWTTNWALDIRPGMLLPPNTSGHALVIITGVSTAGDTARYMRQVSWKNVAGTSTMVGSATLIGADVTATTSIAITVSDTTDTLEIGCTGVSGQTWRWQAVIVSGELASGS